ncbi:MAG TPA: hypothetical protein VF587_12815, partial [Solirubrobacteraceae bacterium]
MSDDEKYDAFGRPIEEGEGSRSDEATESSGGFLPPTEQAPDKEAWWAEPAPPAPQSGGWAPPAPQSGGWAPPSQSGGGWAPAPSAPP